LYAKHLLFYHALKKLFKSYIYSYVVVLVHT